jgi:ATP-dependent Clp protease protease subunit
MPPTETSSDPLLERLLRHRVVHIGTPISDRTADLVTAQLLLLAAESDAPIKLYIRSTGGSVPAGMAIYDTIQHIPNTVATVGMGYCASVAQFLLTAGTPGHRHALPNARLMLHLPSFSPGADTTAPRNQPGELHYTAQQITQLIARHTRRRPAEVARDFAQDRWFTPAEAVAYGLVDGIAEPHGAGPGSTAGP